MKAQVEIIGLQSSEPSSIAYASIEMIIYTTYNITLKVAMPLKGSVKIRINCFISSSVFIWSIGWTRTTIVQGYSLYHLPVESTMPGKSANQDNKSTADKQPRENGISNFGRPPPRLYNLMDLLPLS